MFSSSLADLVSSHFLDKVKPAKQRLRAEQKNETDVFFFAITSL